MYNCGPVDDVVSSFEVNAPTDAVLQCNKTLEISHARLRRDGGLGGMRRELLITGLRAFSFASATW